MKIITDLFQDGNGIWKSEKLWTNFALIAYHVMAFINRADIKLMDWVTAYVILHSSLFIANGAKNFLENRKATVSIDSNNTVVEKQ